MPNPVSHTPPLAASTRIFAGLMSLWIRPRSCTWRSAPARGIAMRRKCAASSGRPSSRSAGVPPGSSSTSVKFRFERIFVFKALDATERGFFRGNKQDRRQAVTGAAVESDVSLPQRREYVAQELVHEGLLPGGRLQYI